MNSAGLSLTRRGFEPSALITYTPDGFGPPSIASCVPSGDHDGIADPLGSLVICTTLLPSEAAVKICGSVPTVRVNATFPLDFDAGVTAFDGAEAGPVPALFAALTVKVYEVPLLRLSTVAEVSDAGTVTETPPGDAVTL
jgi:hypothetical protein